MTVRIRVAAAVAAVASTVVPTSADARSHDGPRAGSHEVFTFADPRIDESSGLVDVGSTVLTVNDSGDGPYVYDVDTDTGDTVGVTTYTTDDVLDVEAIAVGPGGTVWVGDIGDNRAGRRAVTVYALPPVRPGDRTVTAKRYELQYPGGPRDAETLLVHPRTGRIFVVSKGLFSGQVFAAPAHLDVARPNLLRAVGRTGGVVTDGSFTSDGRYVVLRTYSGAALYDARTWRSPAAMRLPAQQQGEGLAMLPSDRRVLLSSEGEHSPVLSVPLSPRMLAAMRPESVPGRTTSGPDPTESLVDRFTGREGALRGLTLGGVLVGALGVSWVLFRGFRPRSRSRR